MQTFLPFPEFKKSLSVLDWRRLGKQRLEASQIIKILENQPNKIGKQYSGWKKHPIVLMWKGHVPALKLYYNSVIQEWTGRKYKNNMELMIIDLEDVIYPPWLGFEQFHSSHRSNLLRKDFEFYSQYKWKEKPNNRYLWLDDEDKWYYQEVGDREKIYLTNQ